MQPERRFISGEGVELRVEGEGPARKIAGYVALYNRFSPVYGKFRERIAPGFFDDAMSAGADVRLLFNHDPNFVLGRTTSGTLRLRSDDVGLFMEADPPASDFVRGLVLEPLERRDISGASFSFTLAPDGDKWSKAADGVWERTLTKAAELFDVGPVTFPWYPDTSVGMRATLPALEESFKRWAEAHPEEVNPPAELDKPTEMDEARLRLAAL